jgi:kumamolisin
MPQHYVTLAGSERVPMPGAQMGAAADPQEQMQITVMVRPKNPLPEQPQEQPHLSREDFRAAHGADPADLDKVQQFASDNGVAVAEVNDVHRAVKLTGTVAQFSKAFDVELHQYAHPAGGASYRGRSGVIKVPQALAGIVEGVFGLDNRPAAIPHCKLRADMANAVTVGGGTAASANPSVGDTLTAPQMAALYKFPAGRTGAGQTIGIIELGGGVNTSDLAPYFGQLGLPVPKVTTVSVDGGTSVPSKTDGNATLEVMLDVEIAGGVAPGAHLAVYFAPNTDQSFLNAINTAVHDAANNPSVISISWGQSEDSWTQAARTAMDSAIRAAATLGVTVCTASGDNGSTDGVKGTKAHVDFPSSSPSALGCGGTSLTANQKTIRAEVVWNNGADETSGGGISDTFKPAPAYQKNAALPPSANHGAGAGRGVPDVSGHAASFQILFFGQTTAAAGTSGVAPLWAGLFALVNQAIAPRKAGAPHVKLYANHAAFNDIVKGTNGAYKAGPGWDACTGMGSPNGTAIAALF